MKNIFLEGLAGMLTFCFIAAADASIIAHYDFNDGIGNTLFDDSGFGNNGTIYGATIATGLNNSGALMFDGVNDYVEIPNTGSIAINSYGFSVEAWINQLSQNSYGAIVSSFWGDGYYLRTESSGVGFYGKGSLQTSQGLISLNSWHHIVGTFDGTYASIYVDGQLVANGQTVGPGPAMVSTQYPLRIGAWPISGTQQFDGLIDEVTIYNNFLSADYVQQRYHEHENATQPSTAVPEPASILLIGAGLVSLICLRKKKCAGNFRSPE